MTEISISRVHFPVTTLGPGRRLAIWVQGCSIRCPGCVSIDTWAAGPTSSVDEVFQALLPVLATADGVTVSGGEPFNQPDALRHLLTRFRSFTSADILVYSGYSLEALSSRLRDLDGLIDCIITDPFQSGTPQTLALRGSDNQRLVCLTLLGHERFGPYAAMPTDAIRSLDTMFDDETGEVFLAGIPRQGDMRRLAALLRAQGHEIAVSEDKRTTA